MSAAASAVREMESLIRDVARYGDLLLHLSTSDHFVEGSCLYLVGDRLQDDGKALERKFEKAISLLNAEARP